MTAAQLCFDFDAAADVAAQLGADVARRVAHSMEADTRKVGDAHWQAEGAKAREYWRIGMVTSLPCFCKIEGGDQRYTQMLPGVVESIDGDLASVRIYAAPEYGYTIENYPLHLTLAVGVLLRDLGKYGLNTKLQRIVDEGLLATGDAALAAEVRGRSASITEAA